MIAVEQLMSKLALGTVQFGLDYGITNHGGQIKIDEVKKILAFAKANRVAVLDTAADYGESEKILGMTDIDNYKIITKTISLKDDIEEVIDGVYRSLENLNQEKLEGLLIHNIDDISNKQFDALFNKLNELKIKGVINKIGFSTYTPDQIDFLLENFEFDLIQVPFNVFDIRLMQGGQLNALKNKGIEIHARSIFLQGVLLGFENHTSYFSTWKEQFSKYQLTVKESGLTLLEYALNFVLNTQEIDKALVGVDNEKQLKEIVQAIKVRNNLDAFSINDLDLLNPSLWKI
jgi:aryl-alcohol dehydrogenase-like predicted oxidoreductase